MVIFSIGAIAGVLVFTKTQVAPPSNIEIVDQYTINLKKSCASFDTIKDFSQIRKEYIVLDDKLNRYLSENVIEVSTSDEFRKNIDLTYGKGLTAYGFNLFQKSVWPEENLREMLNSGNGAQIRQTFNRRKCCDG